MHSTKQSYGRIEPQEVEGWEMMEDPSSYGLIPVRVRKPDDSKGWDQLAHTKTDVLALPILQQYGESFVGVEVVRRPVLSRESRERAVPDFLVEKKMTALPIAELPYPISKPVRTVSFSANPAHNLAHTTVYLDEHTEKQPGLVYLGEPGFRELLKSAPVDARLFAALELTRAKYKLLLSKRTDGIAELRQEMQGKPPLPVEVVRILSIQKKLGIAHVLARFIKGSEAHDSVVRVEYGTTAAPGMTLPIRTQGRFQDTGLLSVWRPLVPEHPYSQRTGVQSMEVPGGFEGWRAELFQEMGVSAVREEIMPLFIADPSQEGHTIDCRRAEVLLQGGKRALDPTEEGMIGKPRWESADRLDGMIRANGIQDGRTLAMFAMHRLLPRR